MSRMSPIWVFSGAIGQRREAYLKRKMESEVSLSAWAAVTKYHSLSGVNSSYLFP